MTSRTCESFRSLVEQHIDNASEHFLTLHLNVLFPCDSVSEMSGDLEPGLQDLHVSAQETILSYIDNRSLGRVALTCHSIRALAIHWARRLQIPCHVSGEELLA